MLALVRETVAHRFLDLLLKQDMKLSIVEFLVQLGEDTNYSQKQQASNTNFGIPFSQKELARTRRDKFQEKQYRSARKY